MISCGLAREREKKKEKEKEEKHYYFVFPMIYEMTAVAERQPYQYILRMV